MEDPKKRILWLSVSKSIANAAPLPDYNKRKCREHIFSKCCFTLIKLTILPNYIVTISPRGQAMGTNRKSAREGRCAASEYVNPRGFQKFNGTPGVEFFISLGFAEPTTHVIQAHFYIR